MNAKMIMAGLLGTTLLATAAVAQSPATPNTSGTQNNPSTMSNPSTTTTDQKADQKTASSEQKTSMTNQWRASKLIGLNVYNKSNENLGDVNELLMDKQGKVQAVIIGVGGFLGVGQRDVMVSYDKLEWVDTPVASNTAMNKGTTPAGGSTSTASPSAGTTTGAATATTTSSTADRGYPDHAVLNASKDELKSMPEFSYTSSK